MKNWKSITAMFGILIIGFTAGFYTHRYMSLQRIRQIAQWRTHSGMQERLLSVLEADEAQAAVISPIIDGYTGRMISLNKKISSEMRSLRKPLLDSMRVELEPHLTDVQKETLKKYLSRIESNRFGHRKGGGDRNKKEKTKGVSQTNS